MNLKVKILIVISFLLLPLQEIMHAQESNEVYSSFTIGVHYLSNLNNKNLEQNWNNGSGFGGFGQTSFYLGYFQLGIDYLPYKGKSDELPDYETMYYYLQWGLNLKIISNFYLGIAGRTGIYEYDFEDIDERISEGQLDEREIAFSFIPSLQYMVYDGWNINLNFEYLKIFTRKRIEQLNLSLGISKTFSSPQWLEDILK